MANYYVIQVFTGKEKKVIDLIYSNVPADKFINCFYVSREHKKKYEGKWHVVEERCFPGYIFVETETPKEFALALRGVRQFSRILGMDKETYYFEPISPSEKTFIDSLMNKTDENGKKIIPLSDVEVLDDKTLRILNGPLKGYEGRIVKTDLHARKVYLDILLNGMTVRTELGINIANPK